MVPVVCSRQSKISTLGDPPQSGLGAQKLIKAEPEQGPSVPLGRGRLTGLWGLMLIMCKEISLKIVSYYRNNTTKNYI